jgi:hypothetical protein
MKIQEIKLNGIYTDGKGNVREIVSEGEFKLYSSQKETDCLRYKLVKKFKGPGTVNCYYNATRKHFAKWAQSKIG